MKFTLSWLKEHLETDASVEAIAKAMTMAGLEVEHVDNPAAKLAPFTVARIVEAVQHPNADRLRVCQVDTVDGRKEIVCGAPNARAGLVTVYAPIGAFVPGLGVTLVEKPVRGVVSNGMLCSASELELADESDGILDLDEKWAVGTPAAEVFAVEPVIDFEVTPNRPDWLGVQGIARDLAAAGVGRFKSGAVSPVPGAFPCPIDIRITAPDACPAFAGRLIRNVKNGPSPEWLQRRLRAIGLRPINALVDVTNFLCYDRDRPLHVYDAAKLSDGFVEARMGVTGESFLALDGKTYAVTTDQCVIADAQSVLGLGGVMGGEASGCSEATTDVFVEAALFDPIRTAQTGRDTGILSDAQYRFARGVDSGFVLSGIELATRLILDFCGGEPSEVVLAGAIPAAPDSFDFDPSYVHRLAGLSIGREGVADILKRLGFGVEPHGALFRVTPPTWRRDVAGKADLVEEVARIAGFDQLPSTPLPVVAQKAGGVLSPRQARVRLARRHLAACGYSETIGWSFVSSAEAKLFGGGDPALVLANPIAAELDSMRPSTLPGLIAAVGRNAARGFSDAALFEIGPVFSGLEPGDQRTVIGAVLAPHAPRHWTGGASEDLFTFKGDLFALLETLGAPVDKLQLAQGSAAAWWHPGQSARLQLGPKTVIAEFGAVHPSVLKALDVEGPVFAFEIWLEAVPEQKKKATKTKPALALSPLMPLSRDFAFLVEDKVAAGDVVRAAASADKSLIEGVRVFDLYKGQGVEPGFKSLAIEVTLQPREKTLTEAEIEAVSARIVAAVEKAAGAKLRG